MKTPRAIALSIAIFIPATVYAQSPPPAQLAPGSSGAAIAPQGQAPSPQPRSSIRQPAPGGNTVQAPVSSTAPPATTGAGSQGRAPAAPRK
jgi:hypothetical protein